MSISRVVNHAVHNARAEVVSSRKQAGSGFGAAFGRELAKPATVGDATAQPVIVAKGTPNNQVKSGDLVDMGGGVYYNTAARNYQSRAGDVIGTNPAAVQQYTDPETYLASGAAYQATDAHLRETVPNLDSLVPDGNSPSFILNSRWAYEQTWGTIPVGADGSPAWTHQADPVPLAASSGVLKAPGPPPLAGTVPAPWNPAAGEAKDV